MTKETHEAEVYFCLNGDFDPEEITSELGIGPTSQSRKGEKGRYSKELSFSSWILSTGRVVSDEVDIYDLSEKLISKIDNRKNIIRELVLKHNYQSKLQAVVLLSSKKDVSTPAIGFSQKVIHFLNQVNALIDIDLYGH